MVIFLRSRQNVCIIPTLVSGEIRKGKEVIKMFEIKKVTKNNADSNTDDGLREINVFSNCDPEDCVPSMPCTPHH